jgi:exosortase/archaeosortase family protein
MVFAVVTLGAAMACLLRRPFWERLVLVLSTVPVGVLVNVVRVVITGVASEVLLGAVSVGRTHDVAGWLMMPVAVLVLWWEQRFLRLALVDAATLSG